VRKFLMMVLVLGSVLMANGATRAELNDQIKNAVTNGGKTAVLALLHSANSVDQTSRIYRAAFDLTPRGERAAFVSAIPTNALTEFVTLFFQVTLCPKGSNVNAQIMAYHSRIDITNVGLWRSFKPSQATKEECIAFYEMILKNVQVNDDTAEELSKVKSELLKLRD